jgi:hypothetical protein
MASTQIYEKTVKVKGAKQTAKLISGILLYILYSLVWIFAGIFNPQSSMLIFTGGILSLLLIILVSYKYFFLEYEYSFYQGTLTLSKVYGKRKIKHIIEVDLQKLILISPLTEQALQKAEQLEPDGRIIAVSNEYADDIWLIVTGEENEPRTLIFLEADDRILNILKSNAPLVFVKKI